MTTTRRPPPGSIEELCDRIAEEMTPREREVCEKSANHPYECRCAICLEWWAMVGPDGDVPGDYGAFTKEEVNAKQREMGEDETA